jgi:hypothetical protein
MAPKHVKRMPDEKYADYFRRVLKKVDEKNSFEIEIFHRFIVVTPKTSFDYLKGFFEAYLGPL